MTDSAGLSDDEILKINEHGPYNHSVWQGRGVTVTHEEGRSGRAKFLNDRIATTLREKLCDQDLSTLSILDVGCYDGWILHSLKDLGFNTYVGIDPRSENIERGKVVRSIMGIPEIAQYHIATIEELDTALGTQSFDVVLCLGVLHHLPSISLGLRALCALQPKLLFIETIVLPERHLSKEIETDLELKDIVYTFSNLDFGVSGQKWETSYYPGSADATSVVEIPSLSTLRMHLQALGYGDVAVVADWEEYACHMPKLERKVQAVCLTASAQPDSSPDSDSTRSLSHHIYDVERSVITNVLPQRLMQSLDPFDYENGIPSVVREIEAASKSNPSDLGLRELSKGVVHNTEQKLVLELAKYDFAHGSLRESEARLRQLIFTLNVDWRVCYRCLFLLSKMAEFEGNVERASEFKNRCLTCNPNFPAALFEKELNWTIWPDEIFDETLTNSQ